MIGRYLQCHSDRHLVMEGSAASPCLETNVSRTSSLPLISIRPRRMCRFKHSSSCPASASSPDPQQLQTAFDHGIWYILSLWPALQVACQNHWGGPNCDDKRDWFAGAISDLFTERPDTDFEDLVEVLLQVMQDEFDTRVEDDSEEEVARTILVLRKRLSEEASECKIRGPVG